MMKNIYLATIVILLSLFAHQQALAQKTMRVLSYNILKGMEMDTTKNKTAFVEWVKDKNPDVLAIQEANTFTQAKLELLAASYGHPYAVLVKETGYPTAITSKHPILFVRRVLDNMTHGFIQAKINGYNFIILHLNPHKENKRREEMETILQTIAQSGDTKKWMFMGDFNSASPADDSHFKGTRDYTIHQSILNNDMVDVIKLFHNDFISTCPTPHFVKDPKQVTRYDFIYVSKDLENNVLKADIIKDEFTHKYSDHYPVMMDIKH